MKEFFQDIDHHLSSKRLFLAISTLVVLVSAILNLAFGIIIAEFIFEGFMYGIMVGTLGVSAEKFTRRQSNNVSNHTINDFNPYRSIKEKFDEYNHTKGK